MGETMASCFALLPHSMKVPGLNPSQAFLFACAYAPPPYDSWDIGSSTLCDPQHRISGDRKWMDGLKLH